MEAIERAFGRKLVPLGKLLSLNVDETRKNDMEALCFRDIWAVPPTKDEPPPPPLSKPTGIQQSLLVESLVRKALTEFGEEGHMLCCGYRWAGKGNFETKISGGALEAKFPNWIVSYLRSPVWNRLLACIGEARMRWLLWEVPMLLFRSGRAFIQLTGKPFPAAVTIREFEQRPNVPDVPLRPFISTRASDSRNSRRIGWTLPENHPLVCNASGNNSIISRTKARELALMISSIRVVDNELDTSAGTSNQHESNYRSRLGKPWATNLHLFQRLLTNSRKCILTQMFDRVKRAYNVKLAQNSEELIVSFRRNDIPGEVVSKFVKSVALRIVPRPFWGRKSTKRRLLKFIERCVIDRVVGERPAWREVLRDLDPQEFSWLQSCQNPQKQMLALQQWLLFLSDYIVGDVVRTCFTVIRDEANHPVFFTARAWESTKAAMFASELKRFELVPSSQMPVVEALLAKRRFGLPLARFVRKKRSGELRLILNMAHKASPDKISPNLYLRPAFHALTCELERNPALGGTFVHSMESIYERYRTFVLRCRRPDGTLPPMYAVALDVRKCFVTMKHDRLIKCVKSTLTSEEYAVSGRSVIFLDQAQRSLRIKRARFVNPTDSDMLTSLESLKREAGEQNRPSILTDTFVRQYISRERVLESILELVQGTYIRLGSRLFRMAQGVPQGSIISTMLCRLYYGAFEKEVLSDTFNEHEDLVMRMVDDYIMFSPSLERIELFKDRLSQGNEAWGCFVNEDKTRMALSSTPGSRWISWCGLRFNVSTGEVRVNYDSADVFSPVRAFQRGLGRTMRAAFAVKCRPLLLDPIINSRTNILINIGQSLTVCAVRCRKYCYYASLIEDNSSLSEQVIREVTDLFIFAHALISSRINSSDFDISMKDIQAVGWFAFGTVFHSRTSTLGQEIQSYSARARRLQRDDVSWGNIEACIINVSRILLD